MRTNRYQHLDHLDRRNNVVIVVIGMQCSPTAPGQVNIFRMAEGQVKNQSVPVPQAGKIFIM